ncbi:MAG TPA: BON domain-containing protein [Candidatus Saccharimonadales bacterium]|nr:BON domain-containing protein [Candidatus Saccharimonadales bacterium]
MNLTNSTLRRILLTAGLSILGAALSTTAIVGYAESRSLKDKVTLNKSHFSRTDQRKMTGEDRSLTQTIRRSIRTDTSLARRLSDIKIHSENGRVSLTGSVRSEQEKNAIDSKAIAVAGVDNVANELTIAATN